MNTPASPAPVVAPASTPPEPVSAERIQQFLREARLQQNFPLAMGAGLGAALLGAVIWAAVSYATEMQIGWMAIGVGLLVGFAVRQTGRSFDRSFGYLGAGLSILGCVLGNVLMICAFIAKSRSMEFSEVFSRLTPAVIVQLLVSTFSPMDLLFYALSLYYGFRSSFRKVTDRDIAKMAAPGA